MEELKSIFQSKAKKIGNDLRGILKDHGGLQVDTVSLRQVIGGMRGIKCMFAETSHLDPNDGNIIRENSIPKLQQKLVRDNWREHLTEETSKRQWGRASSRRTLLADVAGRASHRGSGFSSYSRLDQKKRSSRSYFCSYRCIAARNTPDDSI